MLGVLAAVLLFTGPSTAFWAFVRKLKPRPSSLVARASRLALHRLVIVLVVFAPHVLLFGLFMVRPKEGTPYPGHQYGTAYESWLHEMVGIALSASLFSLASWIAIGVVFVREIILVIQTARAKSRVASAELLSPHGSTPVDFDFGVGEEYWAFHGPGGEGYRDARPIVGWARGTPMILPAVVGPLVSIITALAVFGFIGMDLLLTMGD